MAVVLFFFNIFIIKNTTNPIILRKPWMIPIVARITLLQLRVWSHMKVHNIWPAKCANFSPKYKFDHMTKTETATKLSNSTKQAPRNVPNT